MDNFFCFFWSFSQKHNLKATKKKRTAPCIVLTSNCQFLIIFKYVIELEELVKASPRRIWPRARVRVSKRRTEPLREPVNTRNCQWLTSKLDQTMFFHDKHGPTSSWCNAKTSLPVSKRRASVKLSTSCMSSARFRTPGFSHEFQ